MSGTSTEIHERLLKFLHEEMEREEHHACIKIELVYLPPGDQRRESIKSWHRQDAADQPYFGKPKAGAVYLDRMAAEIVELAEYHADSQYNKQKFKVLSHHAMGGGRHTFNITIQPSESGDTDGEAEGRDLVPTREGQILQQMRHNETLMRMNRDMVTSFGSAMREVVRELREDREADRQLVRTLEKERREGFAEIEAARSAQHNQQIEAQIVVSESERKTFTTKRIMGLLPVIVSRVLEERDDDREDRKAKNGKGGKDGKDAKPWKPSALSVALGELAATFDDDLEGKIAEKISIEQQIMLGEAMRLAKKGGGPMLSQIVQDLFASMEKETLTEILALLSSEQQQLVMRAAALAKSEAEPAAQGEKKPSGDTSGAPTPNGAKSASAQE